jgi:mannose-6-phosphate isomerase-like protein (cupin superfamily)
MSSPSTIAKSTQDLHDSFIAQLRAGAPTFFKIEARLPIEGRTNIALGSSESMTVMLKTYASGGENELHAHPNEDHTFVIFQGTARFYGPDNEQQSLGAGEGVLLPHGTFYWFHVTSKEPLVMLRIGAQFGEGERFYRIGIDGQPMVGDDPKNKPAELVLSDEWYGR